MPIFSLGSETVGTGPTVPTSPPLLTLAGHSLGLQFGFNFCMAAVNSFVSFSFLFLCLFVWGICLRLRLCIILLPSLISSFVTLFPENT